MKTRSLRLLFLGPWLLLAGPVHGDVIFNSFGTSDAFDLATARVLTWNVIDTNLSGNFGHGLAANFFVGGGSYSLTSVTAALGYLQDTNNLAISVMRDNGGAPGSLVESVVSHPTNVTNFAQVVSYPSSLHPVLAEGSTYWLVAEPMDINITNRQNNSAYQWFASGNLGLNGTRDYDFSAQNWGNWRILQDLLPAFRIEGNIVPEPGSFALLLMAAGLIGLRYRRRR